jgi:hypothetical protein
MSRAEMDALGWDSCDIILVTGDAYIDHPSFGMALVGRLLEAQGFRVGIISQPDWHSARGLQAPGPAEPVLRHHRRQHGFDGQPLHSDRKIRSDDAYTPGAVPDKRPDRAVIVYSQRAREAFPDVPVVIGGIEAACAASPIRLLVGQGAPLRPARRQGRPAAVRQRRAALVELAHRLAGRADRATSATCAALLHGAQGWRLDGLVSSSIPPPSIRRGRVDAHPDPYAMERRPAAQPAATTRSDDRRPQIVPPRRRRAQRADRARTGRSACPPSIALRRPGALRPRLAHLPPRVQPGQCARAGAAPRRAGRVAQPAAHPAHHEEMDAVFGLPYARRRTRLRRGEDSRLGDDPFLGQHHARLLRRLHLLLHHRARRPHHPEAAPRPRSCARSRVIRDKTPGFTGVISDLGGPTANMYRLACKDPKIEENCRRRPASIPASAKTSTPTTAR